MQPTLSQALKRLELAAGVPLLLRKKTGVELTPAGTILQVRAEDLISRWSAIAEEARLSTTAPRGRYTIGAHVSVALYSFGKFIPQLLSQNEELEFSFIHGLSREVLESVISSKIDFGIIINPIRHPDLVIRRLATDRVGFWRGTNSHLKNVLFSDPSLLQTQQLLKKTYKKFKRHIYSQSLEVIAEVVASGAGVGVLPERVANRYGLKPQEDTTWFQDELALCFRKDRQNTAAAKAIIDVIKMAGI